VVYEYVEDEDMKDVLEEIRLGSKGYLEGGSSLLGSGEW